MAELEPRTVFAGHRVESVAGRGGMGVVYRATQLALDRTVALKVIAPGLLEDQTVRQRFVRESKVAASIDHPNVIPIYYAGEENGIAYIAMRYVAGDDVRSLVRREGRLPAERAARIVSQVGAALDAAHAAGLVHRDIKPANVLLTAEDHAYLTDFGLTRHALSVGGSTKPGHWVGTLDYVAPEQIRGERIDARADIYALGCLLFYTLTGEVPFKREGDEAKLWAHLSEPPPKPSERAPGTAAFDAVIERALAKDPGERYPSAGDLGRAALAAAAGRRPTERERLVAKGAAAPVESETVTAARTPTAALATHSDPQVEPETERLGRSRFQRRRHPALLGAGLLAVAAAVVIAAESLGVGRNDPPPSAPTKAQTPAPKTLPAAPAMRVAREITVGHRPNVVRVVGNNVFVGSFKRTRVTIVSAKSGRRHALSPSVGVGVTDAAVGFGSVWLSVSRAKRLARLDARTGRPSGKPIPLPGQPGSVALSSKAVWVGLVNAGAPDILLKLDPKTGKTLASVQYPYGIMSIATSPSAVWVLSRRRTRVQRVDPDTAQVQRSVQFGHNRGADIEYRHGAIWIPAPADDTVYKVLTGSGEIIPIGVGRQPRQVAIGGGRVYVTNYNSNELYAIDEKRSRVDGRPVSLPVNPFGLAVAGGAVWVASQPDNRLSEVVTGRDG